MKVIDVSFIIPVYNTEAYIEKCVLSIIQASLPFNYEVILVDDGSKDNSASICDDLTKYDENIHVIHIPNGGVGNARNIGINNSKGKWVAFVDSDDYITNEFGLLGQYLHDDEVELIHYGWNYISNTKQKNHIANITESVTYKELFRRKIFHGYVWTYLFKKDILQKNALFFSVDMNYAEDWEFIFRYYSILKGNIVLLNNCLYSQFCREGSATNRKLGEKYINDNFKMYDRILTLAKGNISLFKKMILSHLYSINIWMVNNVLFCDWKNLQEVYKRNVLFLFKKHLRFASSMIVWLPIVAKSQKTYLYTVALYNKCLKDK